MRANGKTLIGPPRKWTLARARAVAANYDSLSRFQEEQPSLYSILHMRGWFDEVTAHIPRLNAWEGPNARQRKWTKEACAAEAAKYQTRADFRRACPQARDTAQRRGWMDEICAHMELAAEPDRRAIYIIRAVDKKSIYVGLSADPPKRYSMHLSSADTRSREIISGPHRFRQITNFMSTADAVKYEGKFIDRFRERGWAVVNSAKPGGLGSSWRKWTKDGLADLARRCTSRQDMVRNHRSAYVTASRMGIIDEIFAAHPRRGFEVRKNV